MSNGIVSSPKHNTGTMSCSPICYSFCHKISSSRAILKLTQWPKEKKKSGPRRFLLFANLYPLRELIILECLKQLGGNCQSTSANCLTFNWLKNSCLFTCKRANNRNSINGSFKCNSRRQVLWQLASAALYVVVVVFLVGFSGPRQAGLNRSSHWKRRLPAKSNGLLYNNINFKHCWCFPAFIHSKQYYRGCCCTSPGRWSWAAIAAKDSQFNVMYRLELLPVDTLFRGWWLMQNFANSSQMVTLQAN